MGTVSSIFQDKEEGSLLGDKKDAVQIDNSALTEADGVLNVPDMIGTDTKADAVTNTSTIGSPELGSNDQTFITAKPVNEKVDTVSNSVNVLTDNADVLPNPEMEALYTKAEKVLGVPRDVLLTVDPKILKAQMERYNVVEDLNNAPVLTDTLTNKPELLTTQSSNINTLASLENQLAAIPGLNTGESVISYGEGTLNALDRGFGRIEGGLYSIAAGLKARLAEEAELSITETLEKNFYEDSTLKAMAKAMGLDPNNKADLDKALEEMMRLERYGNYGGPYGTPSILESAGISSLIDSLPRITLNTWIGELIFGTEADADPELQKTQLLDSSYKLFEKAAIIAREDRKNAQFSTQAQEFQKLLKNNPDASLVEATSDFLDAVIKDPVGASAFLSEVGIEFAPVIGTSALATIVTKNPLLGTSLAAGGTFISESSVGSEVANAVQKKYGFDLVTEDGFQQFIKSPEAMDYAISVGRTRATTISMTQLIQFGLISKFSGKSIGLNTAAQVGTSLTAEGTGEALAQKFSTGKVDWNEVVLEVAGGAITTPLDIATATGTWNGRRKQKQAIQGWLKTGEIIEKQKSKLSTEGQSLIDSSTVIAEDLKEKGVEKVYIEASDLKQFDQDRPDADSVIKSLGLDQNEVNEAATAGQKIEVNTDAYVRHILGVDGFMELHNKSSSTSPDGITGAELEEMSENEQQDLQDMIDAVDNGDQLASMNETEVAASVQETEQIAQNVKEQIIRTGNFDTKQAELLALLTAKRYAVRAARASEETGSYVSPLSMFNEDNLIIAGNQTPTEVQRTSNAAPVYTSEDLGTVAELRELEANQQGTTAPTEATETGLEAASSQTIDVTVSDPTANAVGVATKSIPRIMYYNPIQTTDTAPDTITAPNDETGVNEGYHNSINLTYKPRHENSVPVDMSTLNITAGVNGNLKNTAKDTGVILVDTPIELKNRFEDDGSVALRTKRRRQIQQDMSKNGILFENWTDQEIITQLNNAAQDEAEQKFQVDQNNPEIGSKGTPAVFPPDQTLSAKGKKNLARFRKEVPGFATIAKFLQPDEIELLTIQSAKKLVTLYKQLPSIQETAASARAGRAKLGWYRRSKAALDVVFKEDAPRFTALLAALSPQTSVESNLQNALQVWTAWVAAGRPTDIPSIKKIMGANVQGDKGDASVLKAWVNNSLIALTTPDDAITLSGPKVNSFYLNLVGFDNEVTNDAWMANWAFVDQQVFSQAGTVRPGKSPGYMAMSVLTRRAAIEANMDPMEVQETIWSMAKALYEKASAKGETRTELQILEDGDLTHEMIGDVPDFSTLLNTGIYQRVLKEGGYQSQLQELSQPRQEFTGRSTEKGDVLNGMSKTDVDHLKRTAKRLIALRKQRKWEAETGKIRIGLSAATGTIPGLNNLHKAAVNGDRDAFVALQEIAYNALVYHTQNIMTGTGKKKKPALTINKVPSYGFYGGEAEPSLALEIEMRNEDRARALAALVRFAEMFNQEQFHVREKPSKNKKRVGYQYTDGSFNTSVVTFKMKEQLSEQELTKIIDESGLVGFTVGEDGSLLAYYLGDPNDAKAIEEFDTAIGRAAELIGSNAQQVTRTVERLWAYGSGYGATNSYREVKGEFRSPKTDEANKSAIRLASRLAKRTVTPTEQAGELTQDQIDTQTEIMEAYNELGLNNLDNPDVRRAYEELSVELLEQFDTLPIKVEIFTGKGEPYSGKKMSEEMRNDVNANNHLFIFQTIPDQFGPPGVVYEDHPLLRDSGRVDMNGVPLLYNDLLRAVHDYFAHTMSTVGFGPLGEEAAWRNHMLMTKSPWARWALTSETRGQNSWVNFNPEAQGKPLSERPFADQKVDLLPLQYVTTGEPAVDTTLSQLPGSEGLTLEQTRETNTGGTFTPKDQIIDQNGKPVTLIQIFESADRSTFLHEAGHFWLEQLKEDASEFGGRLDKDWTTVKRWWASRTNEIREEAVKRANKDKNKEAAAKIQSMSENQLKRFIMSNDLRGDSTTRYVAIAMHEQFARGFENYLQKGEAPSFTLLDAFTRFAAWMTSVYRAIKRMGGYNGLDVEYSLEVKAVMDRMLATDNEIATMQDQYKLSAMFATAQEAGMTQKEYNEYRQKVDRAKAQAKAKHVSKKLKDIEQGQLEERDAKAEELRPGVEAELNQKPIYKLMYGLTKGTDALGQKVELDVGKINKKLLVELIGEDGLAKLPKIGTSVIYGTGKDTASPGAVANYFGFQTFEEMMNSLNTFVPFEQGVNQQLSAALLDDGPVVEEGATSEAIASVHETDLRSEVLQAELDALRTSEPAFKIKFIKAMAKQRLLAKTVRDINPSKFLAAEKKHAREAGKALRKGDKIAAYKHKFQQLVNYEMAKEAIRLQKQIAKQRTTLVKYKGDRKKFPNVDADYMDRVRSILDLYSLGPKMSAKRRAKLELQALARWMAAAEENDGAIFEYPAVLAEADRVKNFNDLSVADFEDLYNSVETIVKQGRLKKKLLIGQERRDRATVIAQLVSKLQSRPTAKATKARKKNITTTDQSLLDKGAIRLSYLDAALLKVELLLEMMDNNEPNGIWHQTIYQPFADASAAEQDMLGKISARINAKLNALPKDVRKKLGKRVDVGELALPGETWDRGSLLMLALNTGNESNLQKLINGEREYGRNINEEIIDKALSALTKEEWELIQDIWNISEEIYPAVDQIYRNENGRSPAKIEPRKITNQHGTWTGGYFPMLYDGSRSKKGEDIDNMDALQAFQSSTVKASLNSSMTKERSEAFAAPIDFRIERLLNVFDRPVHFITHYEAVRNAKKILNSQEIVDVVTEKVGAAYLRELQNWVGAIAANNENQPPTNAWETLALGVRNNVTVAVLGLSYSTMAAQLLGYTATIDRLMADTTYGPISAAVVTKDVLLGVKQAIDPKTRKMVFDLSGEMRNRLESTDREVRTALRTFKGKQGIQARVSEMAMLAIAGIQMYGVDIPTWIAAYNRALRAEPNNVDGAVKYADRVVRISQTAGGLKDLNEVQRRAGIMKIFTMFYSFFALLYGLTRQITGEVRLKKPLTVAKAAARIFVLITIAEAAQAVLTDKVPDFDEEDEDGNKKNTVGNWLLTRTVNTLGGTVPFVRDIVGGFVSDYGYSMSPVESFGENLIRAADYLTDKYEYITDPEADPEDDPELQRIKPLITTLGTILGLPGAIQINRTLSAWIAENDEDLDEDLKPSWFDFITGYNKDKAKKRVE